MIRKQKASLVNSPLAIFGKGQGIFDRMGSAILRVFMLVLFLGFSCDAFASSPDGAFITNTPVRNSILLAGGGKAAPIVVDPAEPAASRRAAADLANDIATITGLRPEVTTKVGTGTPSAIIVGTLGQSALIDAVAKTGRISTAQIAGKWESFLIATVERPLPQVDRALVIVGSDRRGTAFGIYEVSRAMGINPWSWWADITPRHRDALYAASGVRRFGPPSVRYRGIFVNDEDWGLQPWAAQTFDPARGDIGPKTYAKIFELMLRLKANTLWPAMHKSTAAFNSDPANARLADEYGIVMGSSHAEAMLRNNVGEWTDAPERFNYARNPDGIRAYWEERVRTNAPYENIWTVGMRGIHDTGMVGPTTMEEKVKLLDRIIADQRAMLKTHVPGGIAAAPQIFVPYKEVLDIYRAGVAVPEDVTIVWPDDNYGYIRQFPSVKEASRPGGTGVYYHLSYLGYPLAYLWLSTTPPALVQEEMLRAWDQGARQIWIVNVGDIKPAEIGMTHFLDLAWDVEAWRKRNQRDYLTQWLAQAFGPALAPRAAALMEEYFRLNMERRPEHLEWPAHLEDRHLSSYSVAEVNDRLRRFRKLAADSIALGATVADDRRDAWFELVEFPIRSASAANIRFFAAERYDEQIEVDPVMARSAGGAIAWAETEIAALTRRFNEETAGGKWRAFMPAEAADSQWRIYRPRPIVTPAETLRTSPDRFLAMIDASPDPQSSVVEAEDAPPAAKWRFVAGMGRGRGSLVAQDTASPMTLPFTIKQGESKAELGILPLFPHGTDRDLKLDISVDGGPVQAVAIPRQVGNPAWTAGVLDNLLRIPLDGVLTPGQHRLTITARSGGIALDQLRSH